MYYVYILRSLKDDLNYIGSTKDLRIRFREHNLGKVYSTKHRIPFELIYYEAYKAEKDARMREHNLKLRTRAYSQLQKRIVHSMKLVRG
jgi:putative endonuclease